MSTSEFVKEVMSATEKNTQNCRKYLSTSSSDGKASAYNAGDLGSIPGFGKIPWRRQWQPTPVLLPGESHGPRSLVGYSPWGRKESAAQLAIIRQMSGQVSRGSAGEFQADELAVVPRLPWRVSGR